ncbi:hypothetical protein B9N66_07805 [Campylobacter concisus]|uniref:hypothetical protein n=1 Tax=Campylobacter concisus TaxID=199 RepID=UPI000B3D61DF|nr:hypothetical protein [Campylobacter concisus]OUT08187.1 hypothetical protein B9N66_07805 [Campylobacter concisus]
MRSFGLTNFLLENISLFVNTFATIFALIFCFVSGVGIVFIFIAFPLGYIMGALLSIPFLIFLFFLFVSIDIFIMPFGIYLQSFLINLEVNLGLLQPLCYFIAAIFLRI